MNKPTFIFITCVALILGIIVMGINEQWIIIRHPAITTSEISLVKKVSKTQCSLSFWRKNIWHTEQAMVLYSDNQSYDIKQLINAWLNILEEEQLLEKKVILESALVSVSGQELFLSFSRNLFGKDEPLMIKWMRIEGILKTIRDNNSQIQCVRFLVHHQPLRDTQLDFSFSWPIQGFSNNS